MSDKTNDTLFIAAGGAVFLGSVVWAVMQQGTISSMQQPVVGPSSGSVYEATSVEVVTPETKAWAEAPSQTAGEKWLYDVFTPPKIYYNTQTRQFTVVPPELTTAPIVTENDTPVERIGGEFGAELVSVSQSLFRLQLTGVFGEGANARGMFKNQLTNRVQIGAMGKTFDDLKLVVTEFSVERKRVQGEGGTPIVQTIARALVKDTETGATTELFADRRTSDGSSEAVLKFFDGTTRTIKTGEKVVVDGVSYSVGELTQTPPTAVVTKTEAEGAEPSTQTLVVPPPPPPLSVEGGVEGMTTPAGLNPEPRGFF